MVGVNEKHKNAHFRVYLPFGEVPFSTYYESLIKLPGSLKASKFLDKLLRHAKIRDNRFFLTFETDGHSQRILNSDEDLNVLLAYSK